MCLGVWVDAGAIQPSLELEVTIPAAVLVAVERIASKVSCPCEMAHHPTAFPAEHLAFARTKPRRVLGWIAIAAHTPRPNIPPETSLHDLRALPPATAARAGTDIARSFVTR